MNFLLSLRAVSLQSILHSFLIAIIVEVVLMSSRVREPLLQIKFRALSLWLPVCLPAMLYLLNPSRAGMDFRRHTALFDSNQWLGLQS